MRTEPLPRRLAQRGILSFVVASALLVSACGGSDAPSGDESPPSASDPVEGSADAVQDEDSATDGADSAEAPVIVGDDGSIDFSDDVDGALDALGLEQTINILADQLDPRPEVSIDGNAVTFTFSEGAVESDAWLPCASGSAFLGDGDTLTVVYPDGQQEC
jgi:hypothetical protein